MAEMTQVSATWIDHLRHMLGATSDTKKKNHGYRNRFCAEIGTEYHRDMLEMEAAGLVKSGCVINQGTCVYFHATIEGCKAAGLSKAATKRAMED